METIKLEGDWPKETPERAAGDLRAGGTSTGKAWICWNKSRGGIEMIRGMEQLCCDERHGELKLFSLEKCRGDLIVAFQ